MKEVSSQPYANCLPPWKAQDSVVAFGLAF